MTQVQEHIAAVCRVYKEKKVEYLRKQEEKKYCKKGKREEKKTKGKKKKKEQHAYCATPLNNSRYIVRMHCSYLYPFSDVKSILLCLGKLWSGDNFFLCLTSTHYTSLSLSLSESLEYNKSDPRQAWKLESSAIIEPPII